MQQLSSIKKRLDDELEHLTTSFSKLRAAQTKFRECLISISDGVSQNVAGIAQITTRFRTLDVDTSLEKPLLVPLTTSLYVSGTLADTERVIVDIGTGYYVEKV